MKNPTMKKVIVFIVVTAFLSACSQYTCPTYTKKELKNTEIRRI
jgi:peroxiredoxin